MVRIVQLLHPGPEAEPDRNNKNFCSWNSSTSHKRKFMRGRGSFVGKDGKTRNGEFTFWGEWEANSYVDRLPKSLDGPLYLHRPIMNIGNSQRKGVIEENCCTQNTDPLVFGDKFHYAICQQFRTGTRRTTKLADLLHGDIVIFGSRRTDLDGEYQFLVDTVFVVDSIINLYSEWLNPKNVESVFRLLSLDHVGIPHKDVKHYRSRVYCGSGEYFSFVPARPTDKDNLSQGFRRPALRPIGDLSGLIAPGKSQGFKITNLPSGQVKRVWNEIVRQVREQGCDLATYIEEPKQPQ